MLAVDTETTGIDPWHGTRPFLVTICDEESSIDWWEWDVDPLTRKPRVPKKDIKEINKKLKGQELVFQNPKFDIRMLETIGVDNTSEGWDWSKIYDTITACHLINSSRPKDLTYSCLYYLGLDVKPYNDKNKKIVEECRRYCRTNLPKWRIAHRDLPEMPSAKETVWKNDLWLPRALAKELGYEEDHEWFTCVADYANVDSESTLLVFYELVKIIEEKGLEKLYEQRLKILPIIYEMETNGVTVNDKELQRLLTEFREESERSGNICTNIAKSFSFKLDLPKSGNNKSLTEFVFDVLELEPISHSKKTGVPSLDKATLEHLESTVPPRSKAGRFITNLKGKRKRDTAIGYMESYSGFMLPLVSQKDWYVMHPSLNPTGTATLRCSSKNPNEQNISKQQGFNLRQAFGPAPGREWWALDYNNLELRIPAYECQEPAMLALFEDPTAAPFYGSYHMLIASILYGTKKRNEWTRCLEKAGEEGAAELFQKKYKSTLYQYTKNGNFADMYGAIDTGDGNGTADRAYQYPGAQSIVAKRLSKKASLNAYWINFAKDHGYVTTLPDKTVDPDNGYPLYCKKNNWGQISPTIPLNYHVQGTACWIMMQAMIKVREFLKPGEFMAMQVHDELVFDLPLRKNKGNLPRVRKFKKLMESCGEDVGVPLTVGIDHHPNNWGTPA